MARLGVPGTLHHAIVRGIEKRRIVDDDQDRDTCLWGGLGIYRKGVYCGFAVLGPQRMTDKMAQFRKDQFIAGQFASVQASGDAEHHGLTDDPGAGPGEYGGRMDLFIAQVSEQVAKSGKLFGK